MAELQEQLEGLPGYDIVMEAFDEYAGNKFNKLDPFQDENGKRRQLSRNFHSDKERKAWRRVQTLAWIHDKCFLGLCGVGLNFGLGLVPLAVFLLPVIGPIAMYVVHARLIHIAQEELYMPLKLVGQLQAQIFFDLLISFPPLIGAFFSWLNGCLTRNAGLIYKYMEFIADQREKGRVPTYLGTRENPQQPLFSGTTENLSPPAKSFLRKKKPEDSIIVGKQESGLR